MKHPSPPTMPPRGASSSVRLAMSAGLAVSLLVGAAPAYAQPIFQPDFATAASEFSGSYDIGNAIDGSGLPIGFDLTDLHAVYNRSNHWTTESGAINAGEANATFFFNAPVSITHFHMWNHRSDGVASNDFYAVSRFNLTLFDMNSNSLFELQNQPAVGGVGNGAAQSYQFARVENVSSVRFEILNNQDNPGSFTGLAEVAFSDFEQPAVAVPEPKSLAMLATGLLALVGVRTRRKSII